ncbi:MAG: SIMPL domain-containing protein [Bacteroidetes bacterium]|nr:SIMPL domain-containing protein [Bacteroidota bacterium]MBU1678241.1 SIMPL domain-containing protein [Bacteroidota bacterium]MBU2506922.1 SIMPL domain-containing protein [Bacteroidota bacterium]
MEHKNILNSVILGTCICLGLAIAGISIGIGQYKARTADRYVTVKGLSEREVDSDLAIWPITFQVTENELFALQKNIEDKRNTVKTFLKNVGFEEDEISNSGIRIQDVQSPRQDDRRMRYI